jgi:hypothetical protein
MKNKIPFLARTDVVDKISLIMCILISAFIIGIVVHYFYSPGKNTIPEFDYIDTPPGMEQENILDPGQEKSRPAVAALVSPVVQSSRAVEFPSYLDPDQYPPE